MNQEIKLKLGQAAETAWEQDQKTNPSPVNPHAYVYGYKAGAQNILENPADWGLWKQDYVVKHVNEVAVEASKVGRELAEREFKSQLTKLQSELEFYKRRADHDPNSPFNKLVNAVDKKLAQLLDEQKKAGKKFISDEEVDRLIDKIVREEIGDDTGRS